MSTYMFVATRNATVARSDGEKVKLKAGETLVDWDDELVRTHPDFFQRSEKTRPDVEETTSDPGRKRGK